MKLRRIALLLAAAAALSFLFGASGHRDAWPVDWFLIAVAAVAREGNFVKAVLTGAAAGLLEDGLTQPMLGFNAFAKSALGYGLALVAVRVILGGSVAVGRGPRARLARQRRDRGGAGLLARAGPDRARRRANRCGGPRRPESRRRRSKSAAKFPLARLVGQATAAEAAVMRPGSGEGRRVKGGVRVSVPQGSFVAFAFADAGGVTVLRVRDDRRELSRRVEIARIGVGQRLRGAGLRLLVRADRPRRSLLHPLGEQPDPLGPDQRRRAATSSTATASPWSRTSPPTTSSSTGGRPVTSPAPSGSPRASWSCRPSRCGPAWSAR